MLAHISRRDMDNQELISRVLGNNNNASKFPKIGKG